MKVLNFKDFMDQYNLKDDTMNESQLQKIYNHPIYPSYSKIYLEKVFVNLDSGFQGGTHWCCFKTKVNKSYYFGSFGCEPDKFLLDQIPKPIIYHN